MTGQHRHVETGHGTGARRDDVWSVELIEGLP